MNKEQEKRAEKLYYAHTLCGDLFQYKEYSEAIDKAIEELEKLIKHYKTKRSIDGEYVTYE